MHGPGCPHKRFHHPGSPGRATSDLNNHLASLGTITGRMRSGELGIQGRLSRLGRTGVGRHEWRAIYGRVWIGNWFRKKRYPQNYRDFATLKTVSLRFGQLHYHHTHTHNREAVRCDSMLDRVPKLWAWCCRSVGRRCRSVKAGNYTRRFAHQHSSPISPLSLNDLPGGEKTAKWTR